MSHNPNTVKSQDDINEGGRKSDVLVEAISKLETTTKENELFKEIIKDEMIKNGEILEEIERLQKQLDIAKKYLKWIIDTTEKGHICCDACGYQIECRGCENEEWAKDALKEIEELNEVHKQE